jgi:hypothetical protein
MVMEQISGIVVYFYNFKRKLAKEIKANFKVKNNNFIY